jgi:polyphosphate kinase 2
MIDITEKELQILNTKDGISGLLQTDRIDIKKAIKHATYEKRLDKLQEELLKLQKWVTLKKQKAVIIFEGRDAAGKGGAIRRIVEHLNPREYRMVALPKPNEVENGQWYFQRYANHLPKKGEIVFFDRSWYNRAVVEPVNDFCSKEEYDNFMSHVNHFEKMVVDSDIYLIKMYFSISKKEQEKRFNEITNNPLKKWKFSDVDSKALDLWDQYTLYKEKMFEHTNEVAPWKIIKANRKMDARISALEYILQQIPYQVKDLDVIKHVNIDKQNVAVD